MQKQGIKNLVMIKNLGIKNLVMLLALSLLAACGPEQMEPLELEDQQAKAEKNKTVDYTDPKDVPQDIYEGHELTVGQTEIHKLHQGEAFRFYIDIPDGPHAYSLTIENKNWTQRSVNLSWATTDDVFSEELGSSMNMALKRCLMTSPEVGCSQNAGSLKGQYLGYFEEPTKLAIQVQMFKDNDWEFSIRVNEIPLDYQHRSTLVLGWQAYGTNDDGGQENFIYHPDVGLEPKPGQIIELDRETPLFTTYGRDGWRGDGVVGVVGAQIPLRVISCDGRYSSKQVMVEHDPETFEPLERIRKYRVAACEVEAE